LIEFCLLFIVLLYSLWNPHFIYIFASKKSVIFFRFYFLHLKCSVIVIAFPFPLHHLFSIDWCMFMVIILHYGCCCCCYIISCFYRNKSCFGKNIIFFL